MATSNGAPLSSRPATAGAADPEAFADQYTALVEGTLILRQVHGCDDAARVIKPAVEALVAGALGENEGDVGQAPA